MLVTYDGLAHWNRVVPSPMPSLMIFLLLRPIVRLKGQQKGEVHYGARTPFVKKKKLKTENGFFL